jgi:hypothetical protein
VRSHIGLLGLVALIGCGGDNTAPAPAYPAVGGTYSISGTFDAFTAQQANFTGTTTLGQASRDNPTLTGSLNVSVTINGDVFLIAEPIQGATVTPAGVLSFAIVDPSAQWSFNGTMSGTAASGRHTLTNGTDNASGNWSMQRTGNLVAQLSGRPSHEMGPITSALRQAVAR